MALKSMLPKGIRSMLQTVEIEGYKASKEHPLKQARAIRNERVGSESQGADKAGAADKVPLVDRLDPEERKGQRDQGQLLQLWQTRPLSSRLLVKRRWQGRRNERTKGQLWQWGPVEA